MVLVSMPLYGAKNKIHYGQGVIVNIPLPEPEVAQAVEDVVQNTLIRGTKEYNKDEYVSKAVAATSTPLFPKWTGVGKVFYKVREQAIREISKTAAILGRSRCGTWSRRRGRIIPSCALTLSSRKISGAWFTSQMVRWRVPSIRTFRTTSHRLNW
jgi:hypothetical protein